MTEPRPDAEHLWVAGPGRLGLALGTLLCRAGIAASLTFTGRRADPPPHPLFRGHPAAARYQSGLAPPQPGMTALLMAVPDSAIPAVVARMAAAGELTGVAALHLSGALGTEVLAPLAHAGASVGSLHPLASVADAVHGERRLHGIAWAVEADGAALALAARIVAAAGGHLLPLAPGGKPLYHAAATLASNAVVALLAEAEGWMARAGVPADAAREALAGLAAGAVDEVRRSGPAAALTGPIVRGDVATVQLHLARLSPDERCLYSVLGQRIVRLARAAGLDPAVADEMERCFAENG